MEQEPGPRRAAQADTGEEVFPGTGQDSEGPDTSPSFRLVYVPGVMPGKWTSVWNERLPGVPLELVQRPAARAAGLLLSGDADAGLVRLPVDRTVLSAIPLYTEQTVVVVPSDHIVTAVDEVALEDLADEILLRPLDDVLTWQTLPGRPALARPATTGDAVELVAAGIGVLVVPLSLARSHHRKDLTHRPLKDAPESGVALVWPEGATSDLVEEFIGIVRGRTANSTRGRTRAQPSAARERSGGKSGGAAGAGGAGAGRGQRTAGGRAGRGRRKDTGGSPKNPRRGKPRRGS